MINVDAIKREMIQLVGAHAPAGLVLAVYVFGSSVRSDFKNSSDIDLAFLVDEQQYKEDPFIATAPAHMIANKIGLILDREIDVVILNSSSLEIAYEIITTGNPLFESDFELRLQYEIKIQGMYFDFQPFLSALRARKLAKLGSMRV
jgi:predicted nucleotidyltransferase